MHRYNIDSPFGFGDRIEFDTRHIVGEEIIIDVVLSDDGSIYSMVQSDDGDIEGGIYIEHATFTRHKSAS